LYKRKTKAIVEGVNMVSHTEPILALKVSPCKRKLLPVSNISLIDPKN
jgi:ribosomal protein L24